MADGNPHFFRPLLPGFEHRLAIPVAFSKYLDDGEAAVLRSSSGKCYPVNISCRDFKDEGWKEFVADHSLHVGDFLVFRYTNTHKVFDVMAFDPSACEFQYPPSFSSPAFHASVGTEHTNEEALENGRDHPRPTYGKDQVKEKGGFYVLKSPSFVVTIRSGNLEKKNLHIPKAFARNNDLEWIGPRSVILLNEEGKSWQADLIGYKKISHSKLGRQAVLNRGINRFLEENRLKLGDTFSLGLVQGGKNPVFKMSGLHSNPTAIKEEMEKVRIKKIEMMIEKERSSPGSSTIMHPYFLVKMSGTYLRGSKLNIPTGFSKMNGLSGVTCAMTLRNYRGSCYSAILKSIKDRAACIGSGWKEVVKENGIQEGDILMFELVETGTKPVMTFKVVLQEEIRVKEEEGCVMSTC